jgi:hypothetical protein
VKLAGEPELKGKNAVQSPVPPPIRVAGTPPTVEGLHGGGAVGGGVTVVLPNNQTI